MPRVHARHYLIRNDKSASRPLIGGSPVTMARNDGFSARELNQIRAEVVRNIEKILEAWYEHCSEH